MALGTRWLLVRPPGWRNPTLSSPQETRSVPPSFRGMPWLMRPWARRPSRICTTVRELRPRSETSCLKLSISSMTSMGMMTQLAPKWKMAWGS